MKKLNTTILCALIILAISFNALQAQEDEAQKEQQENAIQNPIAALISIPFQNNTDFGIGLENKTKNTVIIQAVVSVCISPNTNMIVRTIIPVVSQHYGSEDSTKNINIISDTKNCT